MCRWGRKGRSIRETDQEAGGLKEIRQSRLCAVKQWLEEPVDGRKNERMKKGAKYLAAGIW